MLRTSYSKAYVCFNYNTILPSSGHTSYLCDYLFKNIVSYTPFYAKDSGKETLSLPAWHC